MVVSLGGLVQDISLFVGRYSSIIIVETPLLLKHFSPKFAITWGNFEKKIWEIEKEMNMSVPRRFSGDPSAL